jgi:rubrerythrin
MTHKCKDCNMIVERNEIRCPTCIKKKSKLRKYQRRHEHRKKMILTIK